MAHCTAILYVRERKRGVVGEYTRTVVCLCTTESYRVWRFSLFANALERQELRRFRLMAFFVARAADAEGATSKIVERYAFSSCGSRSAIAVWDVCAVRAYGPYGPYGPYAPYGPYGRMGRMGRTGVCAVCAVEIAHISLHIAQTSFDIARNRSDVGPPVGPARW